MKKITQFIALTCLLLYTAKAQTPHNNWFGRRSRRLISVLTLLLTVNLCAGQTDIADARTFGLGSTVTVTGIVTNGTELGIIRYLEDATAGVACYPGAGSVPFTPNRGDSITVTGTLKDYNGLLEIDPITALTTISTGNTLPTPQLVTPIQVGEATESELIQINNVVFSAGCTNFAGNNQYSFVSNGEQGDIYVRTGSPFVGALIPVGAITMVGISSQFTFTTGGYQVLPRDLSDLGSSSPVNFSSCVTQTNITSTGFDLNWNTNIAGSTNIRYGLTYALELGDINPGGNTTAHILPLTGLSPATFYYVQAYTVAAPDTGFSGINLYSTASNSSGEIKVYFNKSVDNTASPVTDAFGSINFPDTIIAYIDKAQSTLDICMYNNNNLNIVSAINDAYLNRGVTVRYVTDLTTFNLALSSLDAGIQVLKGNTAGIMHHKFVVIDANDVNNSWVLGGSVNWTPNNLFDDYNNLIVIQDQALAKAYTLEFEEMWGDTSATPNSGNAKFGPDKTNNTPHEFIIGGRLVELYFSPSDNTTSNILNAISSSNNDLEFALLSFTRNDLGTAVLNAHNGGVNVKGIMENQNDLGSEYTYLTTNGVNLLSHMSVPFMLHHKYAVIDATNSASDPTLITGSHNWSTSAETKNDENTLFIHDEVVANMYLEEFMARYCELTACLVSSAIADSVDAACFGSCDGWAAVSAANGTQPFTYLWNDSANQTNDTATGLCAGTYTVKVTDAAGDSVFATVTIGQPTAIVNTLDSTTEVSCNGGTDGAAYITVSGGTPPYSYNWSPGSAITQDISGISAGIYTVIVTDSTGCTDTIAVNVNEPAALALTMSTAQDTCDMGVGMAGVSAAGGTSPYTYLWTPGGDTTNSISNLIVGNYSVMVTDSIGCTTYDTIAVNNFTTGLSITTIIITNETTCGSGDGSADAIITAGQAPFTWQWDDPLLQTDSIADSLGSGVYTVVVTDAYGCVDSGNAVVNSAGGAVLSITDTAMVSCFGDSNGSATVTPSGATPPYSYLWNTFPVQTDSIVTGLAVGSYTVSVTDSGGVCISFITVDITQPNSITLNSSAANVSCFNDTNGSVSVTAGGGTPGYTYLWNTTPPQITPTATGLSAGTYTVLVTDTNFCVDSASVVVTQPSELLLSNTVTNVSCKNGNDGDATVSATGSTPPYTYSWNTTPAQTDSTATGLSAGTYTVTVIDTNGCSDSIVNIAITEPALPLTLSMASTNVLCNGGNDGAATVSTTGGTFPYTWSWNTTPVQTDSTATGLFAGTYTATVTDANGCVDSITNITITEPVSPLNVDTVFVTPASGPAVSDGVAIAVVAGGTGAYSFSWNDPLAQTSAKADSLPIGNYTVTVTDANGCTASLTVNIPWTTGISANDMGIPFSIYPNPNNSQFIIQFSTNVSTNGNYLLEVRNIIGKLIYTQEFNNMSGNFQKQVDFSNHDKGVYFINVSSSFGTRTEKIIVY
ncbi:MAG: T9SS type A sorting domain-containing protein [Cytophagales bacterium]|nr:T9SS type A sorting domain-containing protein [Cytophagales bacterium]